MRSIISFLKPKKEVKPQTYPKINQKTTSVMKFTPSKLRKRFNRADAFGGFFKFNLPGDKTETSLNTSSGAILTIFMWALIVFYGSV